MISITYLYPESKWGKNPLPTNLQGSQVAKIKEEILENIICSKVATQNFIKYDINIIHFAMVPPLNHDYSQNGAISECHIDFF